MHRGRIAIRMNDETEHVLGPGGLARVDASTVRQIENVGDEPARLPDRRRQGRLRGPRRPAARGRDEPLRPGGPSPADLYGSVAIGAAVLAGCPVFPADNHWNLRVDGLPGAPELGRHRPLDRRERAHARGLRLGPLPGRADRHPVRDGAGAPAARARELRLRGRVGPRAATRSRGACRSRAAGAPTATAT